MKRFALCSVLIVVWSLLAANDKTAQQWVPKRIVGMDYPHLARAARIEGLVQVVCSINPDGSVASARVTGNPNPILAKAARENAFSWTFMGASGGGQSREAVTLVYSFKMEKKIFQPMDPTEPVHHPAREFIFEFPFMVKISSEYCALESSCF